MVADRVTNGVVIMAVMERRLQEEDQEMAEIFQNLNQETQMVLHSTIQVVAEAAVAAEATLAVAAEVLAPEQIC
jgi:hypothetical protein